MVKHFSSFRVLVVASVITSALFLVACGGGGGGSATVATPVIPVPVVPVVNAPVLTLASMSPLPVASPLLVTSDKVLEGVTQVLVMTPQSTTLAGNAALAADKKSVTITMSSSFPYATVITVTVKAKANGVEGSVTGTVTTESAPVASWPPVFVPMGTKVYLDAKTAPAGAVTNATFPGQTQSGLLPPECRTHTDASWWKAVKNGTVKFRPTTARNLLQPTRPIVFGSYRTIDTIFFPGQNVVAYCSKPFFADDGTLVNPNEPVEGGACNLTREQVYHIGNEQGEVLQQKNPSTGVSTCYQKKFVLNPDGISGGWTETNVPCL